MFVHRVKEAWMYVHTCFLAAVLVQTLWRWLLISTPEPGAIRTGHDASTRRKIARLKIRKAGYLNNDERRVIWT
jgi:hypothetical protein